MNFSKYIQLLVCIFLTAPSPASADCIRNLDQVFNQGREYYKRGQYLLSTQQFTLFAQLSCLPELQDKGRLRWAQSLFELGETQEGNYVLDKIRPDSTYYSTSKVIRAWYQTSLVTSLPENEKARFENWNQQISALPNLKNPWLSGTLSAVTPGLGQVYNGNYQSALFSFVLNALFLSATLELHNKNLDTTALTSGVIFSVVYVGNIVGTVQSTRAINLKAQAAERSQLKANMFPELQF